MSNDHLRNVRLCLCVLCADGGHLIQAHHLLRTGDPTQRGTARKPADKFAIPLCIYHHRKLHDCGDEESYLMQHGLDGRALAAALWAKRGDREAMSRVAFNFRRAAEQKRGAA